MSLNWVLAEEPLDLETELALDFLDYLLVRRVFLVAVPLWPVLDTCGHIYAALEASVYWGRWPCKWLIARPRLFRLPAGAAHRTHFACNVPCCSAYHLPCFCDA